MSPTGAPSRAPCSPAQTGRSSSCARARRACSSLPVPSPRAPPHSIGFSVPSTCAAWPNVIKLPPDLVSGPAAHAAAVIGLAHLDEARAAVARLADPEDAEALHDFRVGLRRLRTLLRAFRPELGDAVPKRLQRRLREMTRATTAARDAEVQLTPGRVQRRGVGRRPGLSWFVARLAARRERAYADVREHVVQIGRAHV